MTLQTLSFRLTVCKTPDLSAVNFESPFYFVEKTDEELSVVCRTQDAPTITTAREDGWRAFRIRGALDFGLIGILAEISGVLAKNRVGIFAVSTFNTDYILVKEEQLDRALRALAAAGYEIETG